MSRSSSRREREYDRGRRREYDVDRDRARGEDRDRHYRSRDRDRGLARSRSHSRERERARGRDRGRSWDAERDPEKLFGGSRDPQERGGSRDRDRDGPGNGNGRHSLNRGRRGDEPETRPARRSRSRSPRAEWKGDRANRLAARATDLGRDRTTSPSQVADAAAAPAPANENVTEGAEHQSDDDAVSKMEAAKADLEAKQKEKSQPTFEYSGKLAAETNKVRGVTLAFVEPPEARKPTTRWRLYVFKDGEPLNEPLYIHRQTCYLFGRERRVADVPTDHPSCSKQHAVIQYRLTEIEGNDGMLQNKVRPYIMDLGSTNGTFLNSTRIEATRYYELREKDTLKFGNSSREYVLLHENSGATS